MKRIWGICLAIIVGLTVLLTSAVPAAAAGSSDSDEIVIGPVEVGPVFEVTTTSVEKTSNLKLFPGDWVATITWQVKNLAKEKKYVLQNNWTENPSGAYVGLRTEYTIQGGEKVANYDNTFGINAGNTMTLSVKVYMSSDAPATTGLKIHINKPKLTLPPDLSSPGKG